MTPVLVAGIGNIFHGDDGFGVAVAALLGRRPLPAGVTVKDFGIRGLDLTYALLDGYAAAILVDAAARGEPPGTLYVIEPEVAAAGPAPEDLLLSPHELDPARVLRLARALGGECRRVVDGRVRAREPRRRGVGRCRADAAGRRRRRPGRRSGRAADPPTDRRGEPAMDTRYTPDPESGNTGEPRRDSLQTGGVSRWGVFGIAIGVLAAAAIAVNMPDLVRYIRIRNM